MIYQSDRDSSAVTKQGAGMDSVFGAASGDSILAPKLAQVAVTFKRRRIASPPPGHQATANDSVDRPGTGDRPARVFKIEPMPQGEAHEAARVGAGAMDVVQNAGPHSGSGTKRRRRDATRAPGEVVRIVFERPPEAMKAAESTVLPSVAPDLPPFTGQHELVMKSLDDVRATLSAAQNARLFHIS